MLEVEVETKEQEKTRGEEIREGRAKKEITMSTQRKVKE